ncbi:unnamed protein product [Symbiodinium sp. CCMP2592]|nr:unnamed protein product [Symbiodinium sp. CCMP2592]
MAVDAGAGEVGSWVKVDIQHCKAVPALISAINDAGVTVIALCLDEPSEPFKRIPGLPSSALKPWSGEAAEKLRDAFLQRLRALPSCSARDPAIAGAQEALLRCVAQATSGGESSSSARQLQEALRGAEGAMAALRSKLRRWASEPPKPRSLREERQAVPVAGDQTPPRRRPGAFAETCLVAAPSTPPKEVKKRGRLAAERGIRGGPGSALSLSTPPKEKRFHSSRADSRELQAAVSKHLTRHGLQMRKADLLQDLAKSLQIDVIDIEESLASLDCLNKVMICDGMVYGL